MIAVGDVELFAANGDAVGALEFEFTFAEHGGQCVFGRIVFADCVVHVVGNEDVAGPVDREMLGCCQLRLEGGAIFVASLPGSCHSFDLSVGADDSQGVAVAFHDVEIAFCIQGCGARVDERRFERWSAVLGDAFFPVAGEGCDDA